MAGSSQLFINHLLPKGAHLAIVCGQTGCGKKVSPVSARKRPLPGVLLTHLDPVPHHRAQQDLQVVPLLLMDPKVYVLDFGECLQDYLRAFYLVFKGEPTLFIIDDCSATKALTKKRDMLSELTFWGRHADISFLVLTQKYNSVLTDLLEQTRWVALFQRKDRDSFEDCMWEDDVIPTREQWALGPKQLAERKHAKLLLKTDQPVAYIVV